MIDAGLFGDIWRISGTGFAGADTDDLSYFLGFNYQVRSATHCRQTPSASDDNHNWIVVYIGIFNNTVFQRSNLA